MNNHLTRRHFLATTSAVVPATMFSRSLFPHDTAQPAAPFVRRDIGNLLETDQVIVSYNNAIKNMKALPYTNELSWDYQAAIHGTNLLSSCHIPNFLPAWNTCEHSSIFFWSWHRMYLYWFERIIRQMAPDPTWALPYWNYSNLWERQLPPMFKNPSSYLYDATRGGWNTVGSGANSFGPSDVATAGLGYSAFYAAQSALECVPHNQVHIMMQGNMGQVCQAALDPIFYLHHANIDRLWDQWLAQGGRADPVGDISWSSKTYTFFDENRKQVKMSACDILRAAQQLNYTYENECSQVNDYCYTLCVYCWWISYCCVQTLDLPPINLGPGTVSVPIGVLDDQYWQAIQRHEFVTLQLSDVQALHQPGASWEVYVGLPEGLDPYPESSYYVGSVVLFAVGIRDAGHHGEFQPANFNLVINRAVLATQRGAPLMLTFVPHGPLIDGKPSRPEVRAIVNIGKVAIAIGKEQQVPPNVGPPTHD